VSVITKIVGTPTAIQHNFKNVFTPEDGIKLMPKHVVWNVITDEHFEHIFEVVLYGYCSSYNHRITPG
jgi:hypothetical protein